MSNTESPRPKAASSPNLRVLLALVIVMSVLIIAGMIVVGVTIANRLSKMGEDDASAIRGFGTADIPVPGGCEILETQSDENRLIVRLGSGGRCNQVLVAEHQSRVVDGRLNFVPTE